MKHKVKSHPFYVVAGGQILAGGASKADLERYAHMHDDKTKPLHERPQVFGADFVREVVNVNPNDPKAWRDPPKQKHKSRREYLPVVAVGVNRSGVFAGGMYWAGKAATERQAAQAAADWGATSGWIRTGQEPALSLIPSIEGGRAWAFTYWR